MRTGEICTRQVVYCGRHASVLEIAQLMRNHHVGDLVVAETRDDVLKPLGVVTDRDLVVKVLAEGVAPETLTAADLMTRKLVTALDTESAHEAIVRMRAEGIRRLPIVDRGGALIGVLSADDVTEFLAEELTEVAHIAPRQSGLEKVALRPVND